MVQAAFDQLSDSMRAAAGACAGLDALSAMGLTYDALLTDRTALLLQLQGFAAASEPEVREAVRASLARMWHTVADVTGLDPVTVKSFLAFGMLLNNVRRAGTVGGGRVVGARSAHPHPARPVHPYHRRGQPVSPA